MAHTVNLHNKANAANVVRGLDDASKVPYAVVLKAPEPQLNL